MSTGPATILHVEDDSNDALLFQHACRKAGITMRLESVTDGEDALAYLRGSDDFADREKHALPSLVLLDLKMGRFEWF